MEYRARSQLRINPAHPKINTLKNMTISPTEHGLFLVSIMLRISVPSNAPPYRITIPTPVPKRRPPKTVAKSGSVVIASNRCKFGSLIDNTIIPKREENKKFLTITLLTNTYIYRLQCMISLTYTIQVNHTKYI